MTLWKLYLCMCVCVLVAIAHLVVVLIQYWSQHILSVEVPTHWTPLLTDLLLQYILNVGVYVYILCNVLCTTTVQLMVLTQVQKIYNYVTYVCSIIICNKEIHICFCWSFGTFLCKPGAHNGKEH